MPSPHSRVVSSLGQPGPSQLEYVRRRAGRKLESTCSRALRAPTATSEPSRRGRRLAALLATRALALKSQHATEPREASRRGEGPSGACCEGLHGEHNEGLVERGATQR